MKYIKSMIVTGVLVAASLVVTSMPANAQTSGAKCDVQPLNPTSLYETDRNFTYNGDTVTASFKVVGDADCKQDVTFASWKAPSRSGYPLKEQKLYDYKIGNFGVGTHTLTVKLPQCYWQLDLLPGTKPTADDGTADYGFGKVRLLDTAHGGEKPCTEETETPATPTTPTAPKEVTSLPNTGAGSVIAGLMGIGTTAGAAHSYILSRRRLKIVK